jgi:hypothetical protein
MSQHLSEIVAELAEYTNDPLGFVYYAFPWGEADGELDAATGPEPWQVVILTQLRDGLCDLQGAIKLARTSGHGIGKSALVSWLILWAMSTFEDTVGVVTANTENQLKTKTWVQLAKWYNLFIGRDLFKLTATGFFSVDPNHEKTWRIDMVPWSERNTEAFAGLHNQGKRILVIFDEASAIPDTIWDVTEGALTDENTQIIWAVFGNPTRNTGRFRELFAGGKFEHRWHSAAIDSREVSITNKKQIAEWVADYGEDHDFVRVRVRGLFPRIDATSFISHATASEAVERELGHVSGPVVLGVDVGRFGDDPSVIYPRRGRDAWSRPVEIIQGASTIQVAARVAAACLKYNAAAVFVDAGGVGGGVVDRLRQMQIPVYEVDFGSKPDGVNPESGRKYANKRAEIWDAMRMWLETGSIPNIKTGDRVTLLDELVGPNFGMNSREEIQLEGKKEMRRRGVASPNVADALACTFAMPAIFGERTDSDDHLRPYIAPEHDPYTHRNIYGDGDGLRP